MRRFMVCASTMRPMMQSTASSAAASLQLVAGPDQVCIGKDESSLSRVIGKSRTRAPQAL